MTSQPSDIGSVFSTSQGASLTIGSFLTYILPVFACQYLMGVLVQLRGTLIYRVALFPIMLWLAWQANASIDFSGGDPTLAHLNTAFLMSAVLVAMHACTWATAQEPYRRTDERLSSQPSQGHQDNAGSSSISTALWNAWDLLLNVRGVGWNWSRGITFPQPALDTRSRTAFVLLSAVRFAVYALASDATFQAIRMFSPEEFSSSAGGSIYDPSLPPILQLLRCLTISALTICMINFGLQWAYQLQAILFVALLQQRPSQWPPLFDSPWLSTSLSDLWARRWHQMIRHILLALGGRPFGYLFGRLGSVIGVFLLSGIFHDIELRSMGRGGNSLVLTGFFVMNGVGVVLERVWKRVCGRRVGGIWGWIWTFSWLALWGIPMLDAWAKAGRFGDQGFSRMFQPSVVLVSFVRRYI
ncbi:hypothetical protein PAXINDRAFT_102467 [Paxillus involutus ATCC 200175]|uniref:Wax synthase domain-containing protein n=1 Tax=Paxillus involutus ATCC 200175 TaxID=664439 RepID=A0A0C9TNE7_PAXIN|nr:hypothetical protein PAXINDRAFT_102467 [Paxillus involutus ATCC 200175]